MKSIYLFLAITLLSSCVNSEKSVEQDESNQKEKTNFELCDVTEHKFFLKQRYVDTSEYIINFSLKASVINKSNCKLDEFSFSSSTIKLVFPHKPFTLTLDDIPFSTFKHPWLPNDTITVDFVFEGFSSFGFAYSDLLDYIPSEVYLANVISANDKIGHYFYETFATFNIMDEWIIFQNEYNKKQD